MTNKLPLSDFEARMEAKRKEIMTELAKGIGVLIKLYIPSFMATIPTQRPLPEREQIAARLVARALITSFAMAYVLKTNAPMAQARQFVRMYVEDALKQMMEEKTDV